MNQRGGGEEGGGDDDRTMSPNMSVAGSPAEPRTNNVNSDPPLPFRPQ